ncbi:MAG: GGDEF domain-containing protein, partial [bacterium]
DLYPELQGLLNTVVDYIHWLKKQEKMRSMISTAVREQAEKVDRDSMTGFFTKAYLQKYLPAELTRTYVIGNQLSLLMLDVDNFKHYNDRNGHPAGDRLLLTLADILRQSTREDDLLVRFGGEEFIIVLPRTSGTRAQVIAERIRETVASTNFPYGELQPLGKVTVSLGVAVFPDHAEDLNVLVENADFALYLAKNSGRNRVVPYAPNLRESSELDI